jgi:cell division protein FtsN
VKPAVTNQAAANTAKPKTTVVKTDTVVKQSSGNAKPTAAVKPPVTQPKPVVIKPATKPDSVKTKQDKVTAAKDTTKGTVKKAYIIAGTYHTIQEANDAVKILIQKGFNEAGIAGKNKDGYFLVSYRSFKSSGEAKVDLSMIKRLIDPSAWIYEEK